MLFRVLVEFCNASKPVEYVVTASHAWDAMAACFNPLDNDVHKVGRITATVMDATLIKGGAVTWRIVPAKGPRCSCGTEFATVAGQPNPGGSDEFCPVHGQDIR